MFLLSKTLLFDFKQKYILFLETYFFKISKNLIAFAFFSEADTKKHIYFGKSFKCCSGKTYWLNH